MLILLFSIFISVSITVDYLPYTVSMNGHSDRHAMDNCLHHHKVVVASETPTSRGISGEALGWDQVLDKRLWPNSCSQWPVCLNA